MKKIINGKVYDTDKAKLLGADSGGDGFSEWSEDLYQKRTGEFFLWGEGGPMTKYAVSCGQNQWRGGEKIIPLDVEAAKRWAEEHLGVEEYEAIFGLPDEDAEPETLNIQIDAVIMARLRAEASENSESLRGCVERLLKKALQV